MGGSGENQHDQEEGGGGDLPSQSCGLYVADQATFVRKGSRVYNKDFRKEGEIKTGAVSPGFPCKIYCCVCTTLGARNLGSLSLSRTHIVVYYYRPLLPGEVVWLGPRLRRGGRRPSSSSARLCLLSKQRNESLFLLCAVAEGGRRTHTYTHSRPPCLERALSALHA